MSDSDVSMVESYFTKMGIDPNLARESGNIFAVIQGNAKIYVLVAGGFLIAQSRVTIVPKKNLTVFYRKLLDLNDNPAETMGTAFGINADDEVIVKMLKATRNLSFDDFVYILTTVAYVAEKYTKHFVQTIIQ